MTSGHTKKIMTKRARRRYRLPKDFGAYIEIAHQEMYLNAAGGAVVLRMVRHLERMGMHLVGNDPMDVDSEGGR